MKTAFAMLYRNLKQLSLLQLTGKGGICLFHAQPLLLADKLKAGIAHERAGEQSGFAEDLKAVANTQHDPALLRESFDAAHYWREACDSPASQIITIGKAARQNQTIKLPGQF